MERLRLAGLLVRLVMEFAEFLSAGLQVCNCSGGT